MSRSPGLRGGDVLNHPHSAFSASGSSVFPPTSLFPESRPRHSDRYMTSTYDTASAIVPKSDKLLGTSVGIDYKPSRRSIDSIGPVSHLPASSIDGTAALTYDIPRQYPRDAPNGYEPTFDSSVGSVIRHKRRSELLSRPPRDGVYGSLISMTVRIENDPSVGQSWSLSIGNFQCDLSLTSISFDEMWRVISLRLTVPPYTSGLKPNIPLSLNLTIDSEVMNLGTFTILDLRQDGSSKRKNAAEEGPSPKRHQTRISDASFVGYNTPKTPSIASFPFPITTTEENHHIIAAPAFIPTRSLTAPGPSIHSNYLSEPTTASVPAPVPSVAPLTAPVSRSVSGSQAPISMSIPRGSLLAPNGANSDPNQFQYGTNRVVLTVSNDPSVATEEWEDSNRLGSRCLVKCLRQQNGTNIVATFEMVQEGDTTTAGVISCIWWEKEQECFVTSVDVISLLEFLVYGPDGQSFTIEEKNRIRRNMENLRPLTVSKAKEDLKPFFELIMSFSNPRPRNIEKDIKVFHWKHLQTALTKVFSKYSMVNSSVVRASQDTTSHQQISHPSPLVGAADNKASLSHSEMDRGYPTTNQYSLHTSNSSRPSSLYDTSQPASATAYSFHNPHQSYSRPQLTEWSSGPQTGLGIVAPQAPGTYLTDGRQMLPPPLGQAYPQSQSWDIGQQYGYLNSNTASDTQRLGQSLSPNMLGVNGPYGGSRSHTTPHSPIPTAVQVADAHASQMYSPPHSSIQFASASSSSQGPEGYPSVGSLNNGYYSSRAILQNPQQQSGQNSTGPPHSPYEQAIGSGIYGAGSSDMSYYPDPHLQPSRRD